MERKKPKIMFTLIMERQQKRLIFAPKKLFNLIVESKQKTILVTPKKCLNNLGIQKCITFFLFHIIDQIVGNHQSCSETTEYSYFT